MAYSISFSPQAVKDLEGLDRVAGKKLIAAIEKQNPPYVNVIRENAGKILRNPM